MADLVLAAILDAALDATAAQHGWIVAARDGALVVVAAAGPAGAAAHVGRVVAPGSPAALAISTGQPAARRPRPDDLGATGAAGADGVPSTLLTVPCGDAGALELAGKRGDAFGIDDIEIASVLADVAGVALAERGEATAAPTPEELAAELRRLHTVDRARYTFVARAVAALLGGS
jgi:hypothetical protein